MEEAKNTNDEFELSDADPPETDKKFLDLPDEIPVDDRIEVSDRPYKRPEPKSREEEVMHPDDALPPATLDTLPDALKDAVQRAGWKSLMPVQALAIPYFFAERDLMVQSRTGSGKTAGFLLPTIHRIDTSIAATQALILAPTRELAVQVTQEALTLAGDSGLRVTPVYGGVGYGKQKEALAAGSHIVVGTPGRVLDHLLQKTMKLDELRLLILDEADRMMSMGFYEDMKALKRFMPQGRRVGGYMFSATYPHTVMRIAKSYLHEPGVLSLHREDMPHVTDIDHVFYTVDGVRKIHQMAPIIEMENPSRAMVFCTTKSNVDFVCAVLSRYGYDADRLSSDLPQKKREKVLERLRKGELRFLVATDVAARGIDIPEMSHVFQYELPEDPELYVHRAGRTGRAGSAGRCISLIADNQEGQLERIAREYQVEITERPLPSEAELCEAVSERVTAMLEAKLRQRDTLKNKRMQRFIPLAKRLGESDDELAVIAMLIDDYYQQTLNTPPGMEDEEPPPPPLKRDRDRDRGGRGKGRGGSGKPAAKSDPSNKGKGGKAEAKNDPKPDSGDSRPDESGDDAPKPKRRRRRGGRGRGSEEGGEKTGGDSGEQ